MRILLCCFVMLFAGCALSPQTVHLAPAPTLPSAQNQGYNMPVQVVGVDHRKNSVVGSRGGVYPDTSMIQADGSVVKTLASIVRKNLQSRGFNTLNAGKKAPMLVVSLDELGYQAEKGYIVNNVVVDATISAQLKVGDTLLTRTYTSHINYHQLLTPSPSRNQEMLNEVLGRCLHQLLTDPVLLNALVKPAEEKAADTGSQTAPLTATQID